MMLRTIKENKKLENLEEGFKNKMIILGILEEIVNFYRVILKLPFFLIGLPFCWLGMLAEKITDLCSLIMETTEQIPCIKLHKKEDKDKLIKAMREQPIPKLKVRKIEREDLK